MFITVVAHDSKGGIAKNGAIPWHISQDLQHFKQLTTGHAVIMGRKTYDTIKRPLKDRVNIVISKGTNITTANATCNRLTIGNMSVSYNAQIIDDTTTLLHFSNVLDAAIYCVWHLKDKKHFVIGGADIYSWFQNNGFISEEYITIIDASYNCDRFYHKTAGTFDEKLIDSYHQKYPDESEPSAVLLHRIFKNEEEQQHLNIMKLILAQGTDKLDRTLTGTRSVFGKQLKFSLVNNKFPLMTTRSMFLRGIFEELMFYLRGQTDNSILESKGVKVWSKNTSREFLDSRGLHHLPVGDMGHSYGFSMRHFGAEYINCKTDYKSAGYDQLQELIKELKTNPSSRRLRISLWEPNKAHLAALPPCLEQYQFYVADGHLSCMMTQRSSDFFLAGGWNVATGALLTIMLASVTGLKPHELIWNIGDIHVYNNMLDQTIIQTQREPRIYPNLYLRNPPKEITDFEFDNLLIVNYNPDKPIKGVLNV